MIGELEEEIINPNPPEHLSTNGNEELEKDIEDEELQPPVRSQTNVVNSNSKPEGMGLENKGNKIMTERPSSNYHSHSYHKNKLHHPNMLKKRILRSSRRSVKSSSENNDQFKVNSHQEHPLRAELNLKVDTPAEENKAEIPKSHLPEKSLNKKSLKMEENEERGDIVQTKREKLLNERKKRSRVINRVGKIKRDSVKEEKKPLDPEEKKIADKQIIQEELALLKAKNKIPSRGGIKKRSLRSRDTVSHIASHPPQIREAARNKLNQELEEMQHKKEDYFKNREERKAKEEQKQKEANDFLKRLRKYKTKPKTKRLDEDYILSLEQQMEERKLKDVRFFFD